MRAIRTAKTRARLADGEYRELLAGFGVATSKDLTSESAVRVLERMQVLPGVQRTAATGPYAKKLQALWISGWNLGIVHDRTDSALHAFVKRQTGLDHTRFLLEPAAAAKAVEALKTWLTREAGVKWPAAGSGRGDVVALKRAVLAAQRLAILTGTVATIDGIERLLSDDDVTPKELDTASAILGRRLRVARLKSGRIA